MLGPEARNSYDMVSLGSRGARRASVTTSRTLIYCVGHDTQLTTNGYRNGAINSNTLHNLTKTLILHPIGEIFEPYLVSGPN